jgi:hypothetical protein
MTTAFNLLSKGENTCQLDFSSVGRVVGLGSKRYNKNSEKGEEQVK